ncbi:hypothetical protein INR49_013120 [Caranx melampygus]|nr:hypothetical protein INR49_013120 [Caranx melampygus]
MGSRASTLLREEEIEEIKKETGFSHSQITRLYSRFTSLDKGENGTLSREDFQRIPELAINPLGDRIINAFFPEGEDQVNFRGFMRTLAHFRPIEDNEKNKNATASEPLNSRTNKLLFAFRLYDLDRDDKISRDELLQVLRMMVGVNISDEQLGSIADRTIQEADTNGDNSISFNEFIKASPGEGGCGTENEYPVPALTAAQTTAEISLHHFGPTHTKMDLDSMKYAELRSLAKELGLKANMKADKLLKLIKQHYQQEKNKEEEEKGNDKSETAVQEDENAGQSSVQENKDTTCNEEGPSTDVFVNTRRGKRNGTKRKMEEDTATETDKLPPSAAEGDTEAPASPKARGSKKRKVSSIKDNCKTETEPQAAGSDHQEADRDEAAVDGDTAKSPKVAKTGKIPRLQGLQEKKKQLLRPVTPNFKKLHEAHFNKMESIDSYVQRKTKQMETFRNSVKELKKLSDKTKQQQADGKTQKANQSRASMFSPVPVNKKAADKRRHTVLSGSKALQNKPTGKEEAPFRPSVLSTRRINVRFSEATRDNEYKRSLVKTPARMSPCVASSTPNKQSTDAPKPNNVKTLTLSATKTPGPYVFTGNTSTSVTPGTQKKPSFDLKASLSRPLTYKPHTGKLKPFGEAKENPSTNKSLISNSHQKNYKQHKVQTREDRRANMWTTGSRRRKICLGQEEASS